MSHFRFAREGKARCIRTCREPLLRNDAHSNDETHPGRSRVGLVDRDQLGDAYVAREHSCDAKSAHHRLTPRRDAACRSFVFYLWPKSN
jgi:hypothetical protein